jgi:hypothetical protein
MIDYACEIAARGAGRMDHQLHEPRRHGDRGDAHGERTASSASAIRRPSSSKRSHTRSGLQSDRCSFDYFGLNHLGWIREVYSGGAPQLHRLWSDPVRLQSVYKQPLFDPAALCDLALLPTEYVYYYDQPRRAFENVRRAGQGRGEAIAELSRALFAQVGRAGCRHVATYKAYLSARSSGYMRIESGSAAPTAPARESGLSGYDRLRSAWCAPSTSTSTPSSR